MLSPFAVILSEAKDLCSSPLRVNSAKHPCRLPTKTTAETLRCHENACAEGTLECGSASYRLRLGIQGGSFAAALQGASRIFMRNGEPKDHGVCAQGDRPSTVSLSCLTRHRARCGVAKIALDKSVPLC